MSHEDPDVTIANNLERPKKGKSDEGEFEQHSLPDQIAAAKFLNSSEGGKKGGKRSKFLGLGMRKMIPPGTI